MKKTHNIIQASATLIALLLFAASTMALAIPEHQGPSASNLGNTIYVGGSGPGNYSTIQEGIAAAVDGDTVFVYDGIYLENITIDKEIILHGESTTNTIISVNSDILPSPTYPRFNSIVNISHDDVVVTSFTIQNTGDGSTYSYVNGVDVNYASDCIIENCCIRSVPGSGTALINSGILILAESAETGHNTVRDCQVYGQFRGGGISGIKIIESKENHILDTLVQTFQHGFLMESSGNIVDNCVICDVGYGVEVMESNNKIINSEINDSEYAINLAGSDSLAVRNIIHDVTVGILFHSSRNTVVDNHISNSNWNSFFILLGSTLNTIHHNELINCDEHVYIDPNANTNNYWDDGYEGNYWDDFASNPGYPDTYQIGMNNVDNHPLDSWVPAPPQVTVLYPNEEENILGGIIDIQWSEVTDVAEQAIEGATISIDYNINNGEWHPIATGLEDNGVYSWDTTEMPGLEDSTKYRVRVGATYEGRIGYDESDDQFALDATDPIVNVSRPTAGQIFLFDSNLVTLPLPLSVIVGPVTVIADAEDAMSGVNQVLFELDDGTSYNDSEAPYSWVLNQRIIGKRTLTVTAVDTVGRAAQTEAVTLFIINPFAK